MLFEDNETIPALEPADPKSDSQPFTLGQMVPCDECLRTNPPTRVSCIYCGAVLPRHDSNLDLQKPTLRPLEKWELGYNNILVPGSANDATQGEADLEAASDILKLNAADLSSILSTHLPLPIARAATVDEANLVQRRLLGLGIHTQVVGDAELGVNETGPIRVRAIEISEDGLRLPHVSDTRANFIAWDDLVLMVTGRLVSTRIELNEEKGKLAENRILDSSQFFGDELVFEFYAREAGGPFRIASNSFDFSCLAERKGLVSVENMQKLLALMHARAPRLHLDQSYQSLRKIIEPVWPMEQQNEPAGWRRERPGKYSLGSVSLKNNERQFARYSLLRRYLLQSSVEAQPHV